MTYKRRDGTTVRAVDGVSLDVHPGEFMVLLGPSGCGKTTLLRSVAGLEHPSEGTIDIHGRRVYDSSANLDVPPQGRRVSMVFQSYALWPHMTAFENVAYPLRVRKVDKNELTRRVTRTLEMVGIPELVKQRPGQMSGGQQQRVALARALVAGDGLVLFDEPLSNVDAKVREQLRVELVAMQQEIGFSALYVTHDQVEAMELADSIAVMDAGRIVQLGPPREVYAAPNSRYVANFVGTANELNGRVLRHAGEGRVEVETQVGVALAVSRPDAASVGDEVVLTFRPEHSVLHTVAPGEPNAWKGTVVAVMFAGPQTEYVVSIDGARVRTLRSESDFVAPGDVVWVTVRPERMLVIEVS